MAGVSDIISATFSDDRLMGFGTEGSNLSFAIRRYKILAPAYLNHLFMSTVTYPSQTDKTPTVIQLSKRRPFCARKSAMLTVHCELLLHKEVTMSCVRLVAYRLTRPRVDHATVVKAGSFDY